MRKKMLIGSILVLTMLLLMPSIPAIQKKIINDEIKLDWREYNFKDILQKKLPMLFLIVFGLYAFRWTRSDILFGLATNPDPLPPGYKVVKPVVFFRAIILLMTTEIRFYYWLTLSEYLGWDWLE